MWAALVTAVAAFATRRTTELQVQPIESRRARLPGEPDPDEGLNDAPLHRTTATDLPALVRSLGERYPTTGMHHKVWMDYEIGGGLLYAIGFMLWLPAGFSRASAPWPTVFSLHGRGEIVMKNETSRLASVVRHGLQHRMPERTPFNEQFVLVTPQLQDWRQNATLEQLYSGEISAPTWSAFLHELEALRCALVALDGLLDRTRMYLTGVSYGGSGAWAWAAYNPSQPRVQPWAAVIVGSAEWPLAPLPNETTPFAEANAEALARLAHIPTYVLHCANDGSVPIGLGARLQPRCIADWFGTGPTNGALTPARCGVGADAITEALRDLNAPLVYQRISYCPMVNQPTDTSYTTMYPVDTSNNGHESTRDFYGSTGFVDYLLSHRLPGGSGPVHLPRSNAGWRRARLGHPPQAWVGRPPS